eukprot:5470864-Karenia_brevis.AAC.1
MRAPYSSTFGSTLFSSASTLVCLPYLLRLESLFHCPLFFTSSTERRRLSKSSDAPPCRTL